MNHIDQIQRLLDEVELISSEYRTMPQGPEYRFNIFSILRPQDDEVHLHSRFLAELLDPSGAHCRDDKFLTAFLQQGGIEGFRTENVLVRREYRDIDVLVTNQDQALVIENKICAQDQKRQLERYYHAMRNEGYEQVFTVYLTLGGSSPSRYSLGGLLDEVGEEGLYLVSYRDDIREWLDACIDIAGGHPTLRETLVQYQRLVACLTQRSFSRRHIMEVKELLIDERNIEPARIISEALVEAQIDIQLAFWEELERQLERAGFEIVEGQAHWDKYFRKKVRRYYKTKKAGWHYGLMIKLADFDEETELVCYIKARRCIDYGFRAYRGNTSRIARESRFDDLAAIVKQVDPSLDRSRSSIGYATVPRFAFDRFNTPTVFALADPDKREEIVGEFADEMAVRMNEFVKLYEGDGTYRNGATDHHQDP